MEFIDLKTQYRLYKEEIDAEIHKVLDQSNYVMGQPVRDIEEIMAAYCGVKHCLTVSSGTDSLLMALMALDVGPGDEVITIPFTWISTLEVIKLLGAKAVLADICPDTYNIDIDQIESLITPNTKAIMPVSLFGQMPDYDRINAIAAKHGVTVIEDAAQSFGATRNGQRSCGVTALASTSFFPAKPFGCYGDGGALFTDSDALATRLRAIRNHGGERRHHHTCVGINGRFDSIQAAVLLGKWPHFEKEVDARQRIGARYSELLKECVETPVVEAGCTHVYAQYTIRHPERDRIQQELKKKDIPTAIYYPVCCHLQPVFEDWGYQEGDFPVSEKASGEVISLPMHPWLDEAMQDQVVEAVKESMAVLA
ncbi:UDP-2-acetamido-2-deoxy-3-oxo-D-glucuronate aminotransferase [Chlamydiales bacterium SCGC AG-110-P3]|nr:UDP-2-acetamido-2-deoxy-3-oxo-D-glucuronate aminotransferase [Chlamydiales bacterium SCGC AG-110-P3]